MKIKALKIAVFDTDEGTYGLKEVEIEPKWESITDAISASLFEQVRIANKDYIMLVDEEGLIRGKSVNEIASYLYGTHIHGGTIHGDVLIVKYVPNDEENEYQSIGFTVDEFRKAFDNWQYDLAYTAPELYPIRLIELPV